MINDTENLKLFRIRCNYLDPYRGNMVTYFHVIANDEDYAIQVLKEKYRYGFGQTRIKEIYSIEQLDIKDGEVFG